MIVLPKESSALSRMDNSRIFKCRLALDRDLQDRLPSRLEHATELSHGGLVIDDMFEDMAAINEVERPVPKGKIRKVHPRRYCSCG
jgi:hypothetical protein